MREFLQKSYALFNEARDSTEGSKPTTAASTGPLEHVALNHSGHTAGRRIGTGTVGGVERVPRLPDIVDTYGGKSDNCLGAARGTITTSIDRHLRIPDTI